jgi:polyketide synthase PksN
MLDGAMQAAVALMGDFRPGMDVAKRDPLLPFSVEAINIFDACSKDLWAWARYSPNANPHRGTRKIDIDIFTSLPQARQRSEICVQFRGLSLRQSKPESAADATLPGDVPAALPPAKDSYYTPRWFDAPLTAAGAASPQTVLLMGERGEVADLLGRLRSSAGFAKTHFITACFGERYHGESASDYSLRAASGEDMQQLVMDLRAEKRLPQHVVMLAPRWPQTERETPNAAISSALTQGAETAFVLVKAYMKAAKAARFITWVEGNGEAYVPVYQGLSGFYKTVRLEKPSFDGRVVHADPIAVKDGQLAEALLAELNDPHATTDVMYEVKGRSVRGFVSVAEAGWETSNDTQPVGFRAGGVYLITGGLGALGLIIARHLSSKYQAVIYLAGRSQPSPEKQRLLTEIDALGGSAHFVTCDVCDQADVDRAVATINRSGHRLNGIIHSAGVIEDSFILKKSIESFKRVVGPKALGTTHLDNATRDQPLDLFVLFSSVTGALGNLGQCDYGFGNCYEDYFSFHRNALANTGSRAGRTVAINWPYWKHGGMLLTDKEEQILQKNFGITPLGNESALEALEFAAKGGVSQLAVLEGDTKRIHQVLGVRSERVER